MTSKEGELLITDGKSIRLILPLLNHLQQRKGLSQHSTRVAFICCKNSCEIPMSHYSPPKY